MKKVSKQKIQEVTTLVKKLQQLTGKKVVFESKQINENTESMINQALSKVKQYLSKVADKVKIQNDTPDYHGDPENEEFIPDYMKKDSPAYKRLKHLLDTL